MTFRNMIWSRFLVAAISIEHGVLTIIPKTQGPTNGCGNVTTLLS
jgi:hypothetical protein